MFCLKYPSYASTLMTIQNKLNKTEANLLILPETMVETGRE